MGTEPAAIIRMRNGGRGNVRCARTLCKSGVRVEGTTGGANQDGDTSVLTSYGLVTWPHVPLGLYPKSDGNP